MASAHEKKFAEGVAPFLEPGESVVASCIAQAKGFSRMTVSGLQLGKAEIDSIAVKRIALRQNVTIVVRGVEIPLETNAKAGAGELASEFERLKGAQWVG